jgi:1-deoxy-D-xylulose-5-phosphate reductoisomerase
MRIPIAYTLAWPERMETPAERLSLADIGTLDFEKPDLARFPSLRLAREALEAGGGEAIVLNATNEVAVEAFLRGAIGFCDIARLVEEALRNINVTAPASLEEVVAIDRETRERASLMVSESCC